VSWSPGVLGSGETALKQLMIYHHVGSRSCHWDATTLDANSGELAKGGRRKEKAARVERK